MPIRQVSVLWGDEVIANDGTQGLYQNHKPICGNELVGLCAGRQNPNDPITPSALTCRPPTGAEPDPCPRELLGTGAPVGDCLSPAELTAAPYTNTTYSVPRFGNTSRACNTTPFEFEHTYFCTQAMLADRTANPQVQSVNTLPPSIQTNLTAGFRLNPSDSVCVYRPRVHVRDNWGYCNGICPGGLAGERCYDGLQSGNINECNYTDDIRIASGNTPWTEYRGYIIVVPQQR